MADMKARHPSVGRDAQHRTVWNLRTGARSKNTRADGAFQRQLAGDAGARQTLSPEGLYTLVRWNTFYTNPPLCITEDELREAFAIIDKGLEITDQAVV
jgi:taurine--2-oxoglutarate transaminase